MSRWLSVPAASCPRRPPLGSDGARNDGPRLLCHGIVHLPALLTNEQLQHRTPGPPGPAIQRARSPSMDEYRRRGPSRAAVKQLKESVQNAGHRTGLPPRLLQLFGSRDVPHAKPTHKKPAKLPYTGLAAYVGAFPVPGDQGYEPPAEKGPSSPRLFRNRELSLQARINAESKLEKWVPVKARPRPGSPLGCRLPLRGPGCCRFCRPCCRFSDPAAAAAAAAVLQIPARAEVQEGGRGSQDRAEPEELGPQQRPQCRGATWEGGASRAILRLRRSVHLAARSQGLPSGLTHPHSPAQALA
jgi:hypothetical protein